LDQPDFYRAVWREADGFHLLGQDLWQRAQRRGCPPTAHHALSPPAIDTAFFNPGARQHTEAVGSAERPFRLLSIGRLVWKKGHTYALDAVAALRAQGIHTELTIVGDGILADDLLNLANRLGLGDAVNFTGAQPRDFVRRQLLAADVLLHTAVSEGFCNAVLEAQAMGLPVVCSDADGLAENVVDGVTGFVRPRRQAAVFAEELARLARAPNLRQRMGAAGRQRVHSHFRLVSLIDQFEAFYNKVLDS
jgi:colanic acid/amylovoran biosynthesis glycosyltransferase